MWLKSGVSTNRGQKRPNVQALLRPRNIRGAAATISSPYGGSDQARTPAGRSRSAHIAVPHTTYQRSIGRLLVACRRMESTSTDRRRIACGRSDAIRQAWWTIDRPDDRADSRTLRRPTSNVLGGQSRHFCATCTFCARFRHATTPPPSRSAQRGLFPPRISRDRTMPYANYRMLFVRRRNAADALMRRSNVRLTRHRSAPAPRKTAARLSSPGPLLLFFLAGG